MKALQGMRTWINLTSGLSLLCVAYIAHSAYHFYHLFTPELCDAEKSPDSCLEPFLKTLPKGNSPNVQLRVYLSTSSSSQRLETLLYRTDLDMASELEHKVNVTLPKPALKNATLFTYAFLLPLDFNGKNPYSAVWQVVQSGPATVYQTPVAESFSFVAGPADTEIKQVKKPLEKPVSHLRSLVPLTGLSDAHSFVVTAVPPELYRLILTDKIDGRNVYYPILYMDPLSFRAKDLVEIRQDVPTYEMSIRYRPAGAGKLRLLVTVLMSMHQLKGMGFNDKDLDDVKGIFVDTNLYLLGVTFLVSTLHLLLDTLSFKNDISFWRNKKTMEGLSTKTLLWRAFSSTVILFYLMDQNTSLLVLGPSFVTVFIEFWKCKKALRVNLSLTGWVPRIRIGSRTSLEVTTDGFDTQAMKWLAWFMVPLCIGGAIYSLLFVPHKSWYSWCVESLANGVYAFGFLFMLPQLFVNYKLKSVAQLPWRSFMYKALNTVIDDLFAFIITMPTAHRVACFRDDLVFLIYLYQRWLYPVDKTRVNEFGESGDDTAHDVMQGREDDSAEKKNN